MTFTRFSCPSCGFRIFNRRLVKCESCKAPLPAELRYTPAQITELDANAARSLKEREARARRDRTTGVRSEGADNATADSDSGCDDGGGGD